MLLATIGALFFGSLAAAEPLTERDLFGHWDDAREALGGEEPLRTMTLFSNGQFHEVNHRALECDAESPMGTIKGEMPFAVAGRWSVKNDSVVLRETHHVVLHKGACECMEDARIPCHYTIESMRVTRAKSRRSLTHEGDDKGEDIFGRPYHVRTLSDKRGSLIKSVTDTMFLDTLHDAQHLPDAYTDLFTADSSDGPTPSDGALKNALAMRATSPGALRTVEIQATVDTRVALRITQGEEKCDLVGAVVKAHPRVEDEQARHRISSRCAVKPKGFAINVQGFVITPKGERHEVETQTWYDKGTVTSMVLEVGLNGEVDCYLVTGEDD